MSPDDSVAVAWLLIIDFAFAYFFGRAHGKLVERASQEAKGTHDTPK